MSVTYEKPGHSVVLRLNEPGTRNALSRTIVREVLAGLKRARIERARAVVIAAEGKVFCSGANMDDLRNGWMDGRDLDTDPVLLFKALTEFPVPVIAAVHGPALGGGFELAMCCDLLLASEAASFALPELGVGVIPNTALARLPQLVGIRKAFQIMLTLGRVSAAEAQSMGLVSEIVPVGAEIEAALLLADRIASTTTPSALAVAKRYLRHHQPIDWDAVRTSLHEVDRAEWDEGLSAFTARRPFDHEKFWNA